MKMSSFNLFLLVQLSVIEPVQLNHAFLAVKACHRRNQLPNEKHYNLRVTIEIY